MKCDKCGGDMTPCVLFVTTSWSCETCEFVGPRQQEGLLPAYRSPSMFKVATGLEAWLPAGYVVDYDGYIS